MNNPICPFFMKAAGLSSEACLSLVKDSNYFCVDGCNNSINDPFVIELVKMMDSGELAGYLGLSESDSECTKE